MKHLYATSKHGWKEGFELELNSFEGTVELNSSTINLIACIKLTLSSFFFFFFYPSQELSSILVTAEIFHSSQLISVPSPSPNLVVI